MWPCHILSPCAIGDICGHALCYLCVPLATYVAVVLLVWISRAYYALVNVNSQGPLPHRHTQGILTFEKMCCQSPLHGSKVPCHKCISALGCIDFYVKMLLDGCSIPKNAPWLPVFSHICQPSNTCAFIQIQLEHVKDTQTNYFLSENPWVSGWGLTGSRWKSLKICNKSFKLGSEFPCVKIFLSDIPWVAQY